MNRKRRSQGLSLVELLVAVGIVTVLIGLALPAYHAMNTKVNSTRCLGRLRALTTSMVAWITENGGYLRTKRGGSGYGSYLWTAQLLDHGYVSTKESFICPGAPRLVDFENVNWKWYTYGLNMFDPDATVLASAAPEFQYIVNIRKVETPSSYPLLMDSLTGTGEAATQTFRILSKKASSSSREAIHLRHYRAGHISFLDGHLEAATEERINSLGFRAYYSSDGILHRH